MSEIKDDAEPVRGWKGRKYYLSDEAIALLVAHCKGTPLTMSAYLDQLIKDELRDPRPYRPGELNEAVKPELFEAPQQIMRDPGPSPKDERIEDQRPVVSKQPTKKDFKVDI